MTKINTDKVCSHLEKSFIDAFCWFKDEENNYYDAEWGKDLTPFQVTEWRIWAIKALLDRINKEVLEPKKTK